MKNKWWEYGGGFCMDGGGTMSTYKYKATTRSLENRIQRILVESNRFWEIKRSIIEGIS